MFVVDDDIPVVPPLAVAVSTDPGTDDDDDEDHHNDDHGMDDDYHPSQGRSVWNFAKHVQDEGVEKAVGFRGGASSPPTWCS